MFCNSSLIIDFQIPLCGSFQNRWPFCLFCISGVFLQDVSIPMEDINLFFKPTVFLFVLVCKKYTALTCCFIFLWFGPLPALTFCLLYYHYIKHWQITIQISIFQAIKLITLWCYNGRMVLLSPLKMVIIGFIFLSPSQEKCYSSLEVQISVSWKTLAGEFLSVISVLMKYIPHFY